MTEATRKAPSVPPRWIVRSAWKAHRALFAVLRRRALRPATTTKWGMFRITTVGRKSGAERKAILGYLDDGPNLVTMAMNGWGEGEPAWWLNLRAHPDAVVDLAGGQRRVHCRAATGDERARLWNRWREIDARLDEYAAMRPSETALVVFEPQPVA